MCFGSHHRCQLVNVFQHKVILLRSGLFDVELTLFEVFKCEVKSFEMITGLGFC